MKTDRRAGEGEGGEGACFNLLDEQLTNKATP